MAGFGQVRSDVFDRVSRSQYYRDHLAGLTAHQRHQRLLAELNKGGDEQPEEAAAALASTVTDEDVLRQHHRFLRTAADDAQDDPTNWGVRLAKRYYARLFKEYAIADLSRYKESKVGMRWRTKAEVVSGKGQFICGAKGCDQTAGLASYEVNFSYVEAGEAKQALVKLRLCEGCAAKLNHKREKQYKKLSQTSAEEQQRNGPSDRHREQQEQQQRRKQKRRDGHRGRSTSESDEGEYAAGHHGGSGSKRRRHSSPRAAQQRLQQQQARGVNHAAAGCGGKAEQGGSARLDDADIDQWLDTMFASA